MHLHRMSVRTSAYVSPELLLKRTKTPTFPDDEKNGHFVHVRGQISADFIHSHFVHCGTGCRRSADLLHRFLSNVHSGSPKSVLVLRDTSQDLSIRCSLLTASLFSILQLSARVQHYTVTFPDSVLFTGNSSLKSAGVIPRLDVEVVATQKLQRPSCLPSAHVHSLPLHKRSSCPPSLAGW